jgi:hypothetical protein
MTTITSFTGLSDDQLLDETKRLAQRERHATAALIASLAEIDSRRLYLGQGCSSLFTYCTQVLRLSENAAYSRIAAARAARRFPILLGLLSDGSMTLTTVGLLAPHLTPENHIDLLDAATHKSKREVERQVAALHPRSPVPSIVRRLPVPRSEKAILPTVAPESTAVLDTPLRPPSRMPAMASQVSASHRAVVAPIAPERYRVQLTVSAETHRKLQRAQDLLRHVVPNGDPAAIFDRALSLLVADLERKRTARTDRPRVATSSARRTRHVPAGVRREVWKRDEGRCAFVGSNGRCTETGFLELHHVEPYALGGPSTLDNLQLRCAAHNEYEARLAFPAYEMPVVREQPKLRRGMATGSGPSGG